MSSSTPPCPASPLLSVYDSDLLMKAQLALVRKELALMAEQLRQQKEIIDCLLEKRFKKLRGGLVAKDIGELARDDGPDSALVQTDTQKESARTFFVWDIERGSSDLGPLNRLNAGRWHQFFEDLFKEYPQLDLILCRPAFLSSNFKGRKVVWTLTFTNDDAYNLASQFSELLVLRLSDRVDLPKSTLTVWKVLERIHELNQQSPEPVFRGLFRTVFGSVKLISDGSLSSNFRKVDQLLTSTYDRDFIKFMERIDTFKLRHLFLIAESSQTTHFLIDALSAMYENSKEENSREVITVQDIGRKLDQNPEYLTAVKNWQSTHPKPSKSLSYKSRAQLINLLLDDQHDDEDKSNGPKKSKKKGKQGGKS